MKESVFFHNEKRNPAGLLKEKEGFWFVESPENGGPEKSSPVPEDTHIAGPFLFVMIRGLAREIRHWDHFGEQLLDQFPGSRFLFLDLPGNGLLNEQKSPLRMDRYVEHCRNQLSRIKPGSRQSEKQPPLVLIGISLGGMVAWDWLERYPGEVQFAILINTSSAGFNPVYQRLRPGALLYGLRFLGAKTNLEKETIALSLTTNQAGKVPGLLKRFSNFRKEAPVSIANIARQLVAAAFFRRRKILSRDTGVLVLASLKDRMVSPSCSYRIARDAGKELRLHPDAGHDLTLDDPIWSAGQIYHWLNEQTIFNIRSAAIRKQNK